MANTEWMDYLKQKSLIDAATVTPFAYNTLVFVGRGPKRAERISEVVRLDRIAIGSPKIVPAGEYAVQALKNAGVDKHLENKLVMTRDVRECLVYAERGEADGAFVYKTDAMLSSVVTIWFAVPQKYYNRVVYMSALTTSGASNKDAQPLFHFFHGDEAKRVLSRHGFEVR